MSEYFYDTGTEVPVEVVADSTGAVATEGQGVALAGETEVGVQVELVEAVSDRCVGILTSGPEKLDDPAVSESDFAAGDVVGMAEVAISAPIFWVDADDAYSPSVGDMVEVGDGGDIEAFTGPTAVQQASDNGLGITSSGQIVHDGTTDASDVDLDFTQDAFPFGTVFTTVAREWGVGGKTAVIKGEY